MTKKKIALSWRPEKLNTMKLKYFIYARKSTESEDRQIHSIDDQFIRLRELAKLEGLEIVQEFYESKSAKEPGRKQFNIMLEQIHKGKAQGILTWKADRLARNPIDGGQIQWMLQNGIIKHIRTFERSYYPTDNVLMMSVEFGMANQFIQDLRVNTSRGMERKAERGWFPSKAPLGYTHNRDKVKGDKEILIDEERFPIVRKLFDLMLTGNYNPSQIHKIAVNEFKLTTSRKGRFSESHIYNLFTNSFYYGEFEFPKNSGNYYEGKHKPMITKEEYDKIQFLLGRKNSIRPKVKNFAYTGMIRCSQCGALITAEEKFKKQKNGNVHHYVYYHCTGRKDPNCKQKSIEQKELEKQIKDIISRISIPKEFIQWAIEVLKEENKKETDFQIQMVKKHEKDYSNCVRKIKELLNMKLEGLISNEEYISKKQELENERSSIQHLMNTTDSMANDWIQKTEKLFDFGNRAIEIFENGDLQQKRELLQILDSNLQLGNKKLSIQVEKPIIYLQDISNELKGVNSQKSTFEPQLKPSKRTTYRTNFSKISNLYPRQDSNL